MKFTITLGEALQCLTFTVAAVAVYIRLSDRLTKMETKINIVFNWWIETYGHTPESTQIFP